MKQENSPAIWPGRMITNCIPQFALSISYLKELRICIQPPLFKVWG